MGVFFTIRTKRKTGMAPLQCRVQRTLPKVNLALATPIQADIRIFTGKSRHEKIFRYYKTDEGKLLRDKLEKIEGAVNMILNQGRSITKDEVKSIILSATYGDKTRKDVKEDVKEADGKMTFEKYRELYLEQIRNGDRPTYKGTNFAKGSIGAISVPLNRLRDFEAEIGRTFEFDDIDMNFYRDFTSFLKRRGYGLNTLGKTIKVIKTVMRCAEEEGYHSNHNYSAHSFKAPKADSDAIYLTKDELKRITELDLSDKGRGLQVSRDIFLIGVWTAQRVSDYNYLKKEDVRTDVIRSWDEDGNLSERQVRTVHIVQQKTGKKVIIPCNRALRTILDKYPDELPHISDQKLNRYLKEIGKLAGLDDPVGIRSTSGGQLTTSTFKKYELIHSHTARRTGATLMYLSGMNVYDICKITGHSNVKTLEKYIKANELETVKKITEAYDYFK